MLTGSDEDHAALLLAVRLLRTGYPACGSVQKRHSLSTYGYNHGSSGMVSSVADTLFKI